MHYLMPESTYYKIHANSDLPTIRIRTLGQTQGCSGLNIIKYYDHLELI